MNDLKLVGEQRNEGETTTGGDLLRLNRNCGAIRFDCPELDLKTALPLALVFVP
jgi:hypothetical protein